MPDEGTTDQDFPNGPLIMLAGPTAIGKTELALDLAETFGAEIIGVDSMQVYRHMDIGTAKPSREELARVPHHLIDYVLPDEPYSAARFVEDCQAAIRDIRRRGRIPLLAGGTGLYFSSLEKGLFQLPPIPAPVRQALEEELEAGGRDSLVRELAQGDPTSAARIHPNDTCRLLRALEILRGTGQTWSQFLAAHQAARQGRGARSLKLGLQRERDELYRRIDQRVNRMLTSGLKDEVEGLLAMGYQEELRPMQSLGYRHMLTLLRGEWDWQTTRQMLARDTRHYAKRQMTWFRADADLCWFHPEQVAAIKSATASYLEHGRIQTSRT